jgi:hypothetical protein
VPQSTCPTSYGHIIPRGHTGMERLVRSPMKHDELQRGAIGAIQF